MKEDDLSGKGFRENFSGKNLNSRYVKKSSSMTKNFKYPYTIDEIMRFIKGMPL